MPLQVINSTSPSVTTVQWAEDNSETELSTCIRCTGNWRVEGEGNSALSHKVTCACPHERTVQYSAVHWDVWAHGAVLCDVGGGHLTDGAS